MYIKWVNIFYAILIVGSMVLPLVQSIPVYADTNIDISANSVTDECNVFDLNHTYIGYNGSAAYLGYWYSPGYGAASVYRGVTIPSGATITSANLTMVSLSNASADTVRLKIRAEQTNSAATFTTAANFWGRTLTTAGVDWDFTTDWVAGTTYTSSDISSVIQELVDDYGGLTSANIMITVLDDGSDADTASRRPYTYALDNAKASAIHISYSTGAVPTITTQAITSVEETTATGNGNITAIAVNATVRGIFYSSTSSTPSIADSNVSETGSFSTGTFTEAITSLAEGTLYYFRAFANNPSGYGYGSTVTGLTKPLSVSVFTAAVGNTTTYVTWTKPTVGSGSVAYTMVRYSSVGFPTTIADGTLGIDWTTASSGSITGLTNGTPYYISAFTKVVNGALTSYADTYAQDVCTPSVGGALPVVHTEWTDVWDVNYGALNGDILDLNGGGAIDQYGWAYGATSQSTPSSATSPSSTTYSKYWLSIPSLNIASAPTRTDAEGILFCGTATKVYVRYAAHNANGWGWGQEEEFMTVPTPPTGVSATAGDTEVTLSWVPSIAGNGTTISTMVRYSTTQYPVTHTDSCTPYFTPLTPCSNITAGTLGATWTTSSNVTVSGLTNGQLYYFTLFSRAVNGAITEYSDFLGGSGATMTYPYRVPDVNGIVHTQCTPLVGTTPIVVTSSAIDLTSSGATLQGTLSSLGGYTPVYVYFQYGLTNAYGLSTIEQTKTAIGGYTQSITGLLPNTLYHFRTIVRYGTTDIYNGADYIFTTLATTTPPVGDTFTLDYYAPTTIATGTDHVAFPYQRKVYYISGLYWIFYHRTSDDNVVYTTSTDGTSWATPTIIGNASLPCHFTTYYDGTYLYYVRANPNISANVYFRRGAPQSNGTITWSAVEQTPAVNMSQNHGLSALYSVVADTNGKAFIEYRRTGGTYGDVVIIRNANSDGTWTTDGTGEFVLSTATGGYNVASMVPLTNGKVYAIAGQLSGSKGSVYNSGWGAIETAYSLPTWDYSMVSHGDIVEIQASNYCYTRTAAGVWSYATVISSGTQLLAPSLTLVGEDDLVMTFITMSSSQGSTGGVGLSYNSGYYISRINGVWGTPVRFINEASALMHDNDWTTASYQAQSNKIGFLYSTGAVGSTATALKFSSLTVNYGTTPPSTIPTITTIAEISTTNDGSTLQGSLDSLGNYSPVYAYFQYVQVVGYTGTYDYSTVEQTKSVAGGYSQSISGLLPNTSYYYRAVVRYGASAYVYGLQRTFTTSALSVPAITTNIATAISPSAATLQGTLSSLGGYTPVYVYFEYGLTVAYGSVTIEQTKTATGGYNQALSELIPNTLYHYRAVVRYSGVSVVNGADITFTTSTTAIPVVTTNTPSGVTSTSVNLLGNLDTLGNYGTVYVSFQYGLTTNYVDTTTEEAKTSIGSFSYGLTSLQGGTTYYYRARVRYGTNVYAYGASQSFTTIATVSPPTTYEALSTGQDGDSAKIYGANWADMQFTVGASSHTAASIHLYIKRLGNPGVVTISLRNAAAGVPTGVDLVSTTFDGNLLTTGYDWYSYDVSETTLTTTQQYAIVVRAVAGDINNCVYWGIDTGGGLANAVYGTSANSGVLFTSDPPKDALFEIWSNPLSGGSLSVMSARVFTGYRTSGDWLIIADVNNVYPPYYPNYDPQLYFQLQLISGTTIKASTPFKAWGRQPLAIYLSPSTAGALTWGSGYKVRAQLLGGVYQEYSLVPTDWNGGSLLYLDGYITNLASVYETYYSETFLVNTASGGRILNIDGGVMFLRGIADLNSRRPTLFEANTASTAVTAKTFTHTGTSSIVWSDQVGSKVATILTEAGSFIGIGGKDTLNYLFLALAVILAVVLGAGGNFGGAMLASLPIIGIDIWLGGFSIEDAAAIALIAIFLIVRAIIWNNSAS